MSKSEIEFSAENAQKLGNLISRSALLEQMHNHYEVRNPKQNATMDECCMMVIHAPAVDAVAVVRCKDCKHSYKGSPHGLMCECPVGGQNTSLLGGDDFCSNGERRADDAD